jgi:hypothetical protein
MMIVVVDDDHHHDHDRHRRPVTMLTKNTGGMMPTAVPTPMVTVARKAGGF